LGAFELTVFKPLISPAVSENDASVAVRVEGPEGTLLLTGDLEVAGEAALLEAGLTAVDVLKAPHHGSRTSSGAALLGATCPRATVFSVGHQNRYGLPHAEVVARYARWGVAAWRTDQDGRVRVRLSHPARIEAHRRGPIALADLPRSCTRPPPEVALGTKEPRS
jgi:competence protein ComEC